MKRRTKTKDFLVLTNPNLVRPTFGLVFVSVVVAEKNDRFYDSNKLILMDSEPPKYVQARRCPQAMAISLVKGGNAAWAYLGGAFRVSR